MVGYGHIVAENGTYGMSSVFFEDDELNYKRKILFQVLVQKAWFRKRDAFTDRLSVYERAVAKQPEIKLPLNAGNMIYTMMQKLELGIDWEKQDALIASYRNLMYKMSYADVKLKAMDMAHLSISGQKSDVMWALSFLSQVFPEEAIKCETTTGTSDDEKTLVFSIRNGQYVGEGAMEAQMSNDALPDIWSADVKPQVEIEDNSAYVEYSSSFRPVTGDIFAIPDGRIATYVSMTDRFRLADEQKKYIDIMNRHNISASLIKDFEDLIRRQTKMKSFDVYQMRYKAFMNKVHALEHTIHGFEASVYDILPIGERGLPYAKNDTIQRTNWMDAGSLVYVIDKVERNREGLSDRERKKTAKDAGTSTILRCKGYDVEYKMYKVTGTPDDLCQAIHDDRCFELYADFAQLDSMRILNFPASVYKALCNDPEEPSIYKMSEFEKQKIRLFGRGYADFLAYQIDHLTNRRQVQMYQVAFDQLSRRYLADHPPVVV